MSPKDFNNAIQKLSAALITQVPTINEKMAMDATALIKDRIINTGVDGNGKSLGKYSENPLPLFFFKGKSLNAGGDAAIKNAEKAKKGLSYEEWRLANNRPVDHVTLSFTGQTMKDIGVVKEVVDGTKVITTVGAKNTISRDKGVDTETILDEYLGPRYGNFLEPNENEAQILKDYLENQIANIIHDCFKS